MFKVSLGSRILLAITYFHRIQLNFILIFNFGLWMRKRNRLFVHYAFCMDKLLFSYAVILELNLFVDSHAMMWNLFFYAKPYF